MTLCGNLKQSPNQKLSKTDGWRYWSGNQSRHNDARGTKMAQVSIFRYWLLRHSDFAALKRLLFWGICAMISWMDRILASGNFWMGPHSDRLGQWPIKMWTRALIPPTPYDVKGTRWNHIFCYNAEEKLVYFHFYGAFWIFSSTILSSRF